MRPRFTGSNPDDILNDQQIAFTHIYDLSSEAPLDNALRFYQKFVYIHPFYDGNGRVARLFVNLYLYKHKLFIDWKNLQSKGDFLRKLNNYHDSGLGRHFKWWVKVCEKLVSEISEEDEKG